MVCISDGEGELLSTKDGLASGSYFEPEPTTPAICAARRVVTWLTAGSAMIGVGDRKAAVQSARDLGIL